MTKGHKLIYKYLNNASFEATYYPEDSEGIPKDDKFELKFNPENRESITIRITFQEAIHIINALTHVMDKYLDNTNCYQIQELMTGI
jgi:hypothetical protein